ncbi:MAG: outer membrane beta-barrel protein [Rhizobiaceae bacterium]|nr:outer membrane beta-barrel protein [Rhizobiaceae bacterium]MCV0406929.1 outer membrane beta-barrel protein [Rhizobiaceae bacterium]
MASRNLTTTRLLAGVALAVLVAWPAAAQLRGRVEEGEIYETVLDRQVQPQRAAALEDDGAGIPTPRYRPASDGALEVDDEEGRASRSLFNEPDPADPFEDIGAREPSARPVSARQRAEEARERRESGPQTAIERRQAETDRRATSRASALDPVSTGTVPTDRIDLVDPGRRLPVERAGRVNAIGAPSVVAEEDPYAPLGLRVGTFDVTTTLDQLIGHSTNPDFTLNGDGATISETDLRVTAVSDWSRHSARIDAYGTYRKSLSGVEVEDEEAGISGALDLEIGDRWGASLAAGYSIRPESASSPVEIPGAASRPLRQTLTGRAGIAKDEGKLRLALTGDVERAMFDDAELVGGGTLSQEDRNYTLATAKLRAGYEVSPALVPFAEVEYGRRFYDLTVDSAGYERSANRLGLRAGTSFDFGEKLSGEVALGWLRESIDDPRLDDISGFTADGSVAWSPQRGTIVRLLGYTAVDGTTAPGESGSILYSGTLSVERRLRANVTGTASVGAYYRDYVGTNGYDQGLIGEASATWWLSRYVGLIGRARYETQESNLPGRGADAASVFAGVRLQR